MQSVHDMPFGARLNPDGSADFALWAPNARSVALVLQQRGQPDQHVEVPPADEGWYRTTLAEARDGQLYRWRIDGELDVPDPASRFNPEGPHGPSQLVDAADFQWDGGWQGRPWHEVVLYELHVGCFTQAGTYAAAMAELPRLAELGVTAVQLMPLADFPGRFGWGYDGVLPFAPFHGYGTPQELKAFIHAAHRLKLMVFCDVVYNHFGPDGNHLPRYAPDFFSQRHSTAWGPALNFDGDNADTVRSFFIHNALYWLQEYRFDGLRFDAVHAMLDDRRPDIMDALSLQVREACGERHVHLVLENDSNDIRRLGPPGTPGRFDGQWNGDFHHTLHVRLTDEHDGYYAEYDQPVAQLARCLTHGFARQGGPHNSEHAEPRGPAEGHTPLNTVVNFIQNHDQIGNRAFGDRLISLADPAAVKLAAAITCLSPSPPLLFMGEETGATAPFQYFADWQGDLQKAVREGRQREFAHFPRYAEAAQRGELPDPCSEATFHRCKLPSAAGISAAQRVWMVLYTELLKARHQQLVPHLPQLSPDGHRCWQVGTEVLLVRWAFEDGRTLEMLANLSGHAVRLSATDLPPPLAEASLLYRIGDFGVDLIGLWSARWQWGLDPTSPDQAEAAAEAEPGDPLHDEASAREMEAALQHAASRQAPLADPEPV